MIPNRFWSLCVAVMANIEFSPGLRVDLTMKIYSLETI